MASPADLLACRSVARLLSAWIARERVADPRFSGRAFARRIGERNQTILHSAAAGDRRLTLTQVARWLPAMHLSHAEQEHLLALVRREEAEAELRLLQARAGDAPDADAQVQIALGEEAVRRARTLAQRASSPVSGPADAPREGHEVLGRIDDVQTRAPERTLRLSELRGDALACLVTDSPGAPLPLFGLTEAVSVAQIARLRAELRRAGDDLLTARDGGPRWFVQLSLFSLARPLDMIPPVLPADAPKEPGEDAPRVSDWTAPGGEGAIGWLSAWMRWRQRFEPGFSHASAARLCGQSDRAILWKILHGRQGLTPGRARALARGLGLDEDEEELLALLADRDRRPTPEARALIQQEIDQRVALLGASVLTLRRARLLSGWAPYAIHELAACTGFQADPVWISAALEGRITPSEAERALAMLFSARMLASLPEGLRPAAERWQLDRPAHATSPEDAVLRYHQAMAEQERQALQRWLAGARDPNLLALSLEVSAPQQVLFARLQALFERSQGLCAGSDARTQVVQICLHGWSG